MKTIYKYILFVLFIFLGIFLSHFYRPYIFKNNLFDFGIADMGSNLFLIPTTLLLISILNLCSTENNYKILFFLITVGVFHEVLSYFFKYFGTFDWKDIVAYLFSFSMLPIVDKVCKPIHPS